MDARAFSCDSILCKSFARFSSVLHLRQLATTLSTRACRKELTSLVAFPDTDTTGRVFYKSSRASVRHISPYSVDSGRTPV